MNKTKFNKLTKPESVVAIGNSAFILTDPTDSEAYIYTSLNITRNMSRNRNGDVKYNKTTIFIPLSPLYIIDNLDKPFETFNVLTYHLKAQNAKFSSDPSTKGDIKYILYYTGYTGDDELIKISELGYVKTIAQAKDILKNYIENFPNLHLCIDGTRCGVNFNIHNDIHSRKYFYCGLLPWYNRLELPHLHESIRERFENECIS